MSTNPSLGGQRSIGIQTGEELQKGSSRRCLFPGDYDQEVKRVLRTTIQRSISVQTDDSIPVVNPTVRPVGAWRPKSRTEPSIPPPIPDIVPTKSYLDYLSARRTVEPMSGYGYGYGVESRPGKPKDFRAEKTRLAQSDPGYEDEHPSERHLERAPGTGGRAVYGAYMGQPLHGPAEYHNVFPDWQSVGEQYVEPIPSSRPFPMNEEYYLKQKGFKFVSFLGEGGFGAVWDVVSSKLFRGSDGQFIEYRMACKVLNLAHLRGDLMADDPNVTVQRVVTELVREADLLQSLKHIHILECYQVFYIHDQETGFPYCRCLIFMELCDGDLKSLLKGNKHFEEYQAFDMFDQTSDAIMYLHEQNVCHLDLKIANVMFIAERDGKRVYKLADFGLSKRFASGQSPKLYESVGTVRYLPPEVNDDFYDAKPVDIYCFALILAECLSGIGRFTALMTDLKNPTEQVCANWGISRVCADLLCRMTAVDPNERPTIRDLRRHKWFSIKPATVGRQYKWWGTDPGQVQAGRSTFYQM